MKEDCYYCMGSGYDDYDELGVCPFCDGAGYIFVEVEDEDEDEELC